MVPMNVGVGPFVLIDTSGGKPTFAADAIYDLQIAKADLKNAEDRTFGK